MTTAQDLVEEVRRYLFAGQRETLNLLSSNPSNSDTTLTFSNDLGPLVAGTYLSIDLEIMYVWSVSTASKTATVQRGMLGSTAVSHTAGTIVYVNSKFPTFSIFTEINNDINDLSSPTNGLYAVGTVDVTYNPSVQGYDLNASVIDVLSVTAQTVGPSKEWVQLGNWRLDPNAQTATFPSGQSITLYQGGDPGRTVRITYSKPFTAFSALTDNLSTTGMAASMADIPPLGAAMRLAGVREVKRNFTESQGDTRRASEVPPNAQVAGMTVLMRERARRIKAEAARLASSWPTMRRFV